ncbi:MAG: rRNA maturation RNase YbeY [bacterium]|jgi:probable rRNA maturation factor
MNIQRKEKLNQKLVRYIVEKAVSNLFYGPFKIDIIFCSAAYIKNLNKKYRDKNKATDILSFEFKEYEYDENVYFIGELFICPSIAKKNALDFKDFWDKEGWASKNKTKYLIKKNTEYTDFEKEIVLLLIHGILHLFGYDHTGDDDDNEEMKKLQNFLYIDAAIS